MEDMRLVSGVDIVAVARIEKILAGKRDIFLKKIFTRKEIRYIEGKNYSGETISGLFAGKEAISKALGTGIGSIGWQDMEILHDELGRPQVRISDEILSRHRMNSLEISISHERDYAIAFVVGLKY